MNLRLFASVFGIEVRKSMTYRVDFWIQVLINFLAAIAIPYFFWKEVYRVAETPRLGDYTLEAMLVYICLAVLIGRLVRGADLHVDVANDIYEGHLNKYLLYPTGYLAFKYAQHVGALLPHILQLLLFLPILYWIAGLPEDMEITPLSIHPAVSSGCRKRAPPSASTTRAYRW